MKLSDFDYELPQEAIASEPARPRDSARLLDLTGTDMADRRISDLPAILKDGDLLVVNDTRVIPARLSGRRGGAGISITLHRHEGGARWCVFARPARKCRPDDVILLVLQGCCASDAAPAVRRSACTRGGASEYWDDKDDQVRTQPNVRAGIAD